jgi:chromosome segregation protein
VLERERGLLERFDTQLAARQERIAELSRERQTLQTRSETLHTEAKSLEESLRQVRAQIRPAEDELARLTDKQEKMEQAHRRAQERLVTLESQLNQAELEVARRRDQIENLARRIEEDLGLVELELVESVTAQTPLPLEPVVSRLPIVEVLPEGLEEEIKLLKGRLNRMRNINPNAPEEYLDVKERYEFLSEQLADLDVTSTTLRQAVAELDEKIEIAFQETFDGVATTFSHLFATLFAGGTAHLELTEPDDVMNTGVEIMARPPGKRSQRLALLSGGERTLTAVALLFALLRYSSTPFCVLDEVDAMLDETNVGRFRTIMKDMGEQTQFVVITHNRGTVEAADTVYGISIGVDGVSQVVSLNLEEERDDKA